MDFPEHRDSVLQLCHADDSTTFGTAFVVHLGQDGQGTPTAYLVTCAHVVDDCQNNMVIGRSEIPVKLVKSGGPDVLDVAVVEVKYPKAQWQALSVVGFRSMQLEIAPECFHAVGFREADGSLYRIALDAKFDQYVECVLDDGCDLRLIRFRLPASVSEQANELTQGYSGSPLLAPCGVYGVVNRRERSADQRTWTRGTAIPLWHLAKIWSNIPSKLGEQLFGGLYWPILEQLSVSTANCTSEEFRHAFQKVLHDNRPEEYSLWGCAVTLAQFENEDQPVTRLRRFVQALADVTNRTELLTGPSLPEQEASDEPPASTSEKTYRRLIVRIVEQRVSARSDRQQGRRYQVQVHTATCQEPDGRYCGQGCVACGAPAGGRLKTVWARSLEGTSESGLRDILAEEIEDIVGIFGSELPDLVQIMAPEGLLPKAIFEMCLDQLRAAGPRPLCLLHPTVFSGESRSNPLGQGRYLLPRIGPPHSQWTGGRVRLQSIADAQDLYRQLDGESTAVAVTSDRGIAEECLYSAVPVIVVAEDSVEPIEAVIDATECLHRLPHTLHRARLSHRLVYDNPRIAIEFAEGDSPHVDGK